MRWRWSVPACAEAAYSKGEPNWRLVIWTGRGRLGPFNRYKSVVHIADLIINVHAEW